MFASDDGRVRVECRFESDTIWLSQSAMADLYAKDVRTINEHLMNIFSDGEIDQNSTIRKFRIVRQEGKRQECVASLSGKLPVTSFINPSPPKERDRIFAIRVTEVPYSSGPHI
jgi:hypothetical protein